MWWGQARSWARPIYTQSAGWNQRYSLEKWYKVRVRAFEKFGKSVVSPLGLLGKLSDRSSQTDTFSSNGRENLNHIFQTDISKGIKLGKGQVRAMMTWWMRVLSKTWQRPVMNVPGENSDTALWIFRLLKSSSRKSGYSGRIFLSVNRAINFQKKHLN